MHHFLEKLAIILGCRYLIRFANTWTRNIKQSAKSNTARMSGGGWNVKFKKMGKSLCVVYPKNGYFTVLVVVGNKEKERLENQLPHLSKEIQELYQNTKEGNGQRWLMIDVHSDNCIYDDVLQMIHIRRTSK